MRRAAICLTLSVLGVSSTVSAQEQQFERGLKARDELRWRDVITQMTLAIQADNKESDKKYGRALGFLGGGTEYLPYFFLGEAYFKNNECAPAIEAWARSDQQAIVKRRADFVKIMKEGNEACEARGVLLPGKFETALQTTQKYYEDANNLAARIGPRAQANIGLWSTDMREQFDRAGADLRESFAKLTSGAKSRLLSEFNESRAAADRARTTLVAVDASLSAAIVTNQSIQQQVAGIEKILTDAEGYDTAIESKKAIWAPSHSSGIESGRDALRRGRDRLAAAARASNPSLLSEARDLAGDASSKLKRVLDELTRIERADFDRAMSEQLATGHEVFSFIEAGFSTLNGFITNQGETPEASKEREEIERTVSGARRRLDTARKTENLGGVRDATRVASEALERLNALISTFGRPTLTQRGVDPVLQDGVRLFFEGKYEAALTALEPARNFGPEVTLQLHAHLVRAAALHALFVRSGESDLSLRTRALEEIARCRSLSPGIVPDERFSPRFIAFFQGSGGEPPIQSATGSRP